MNYIKVGRRHHTFPQHYRKIIEESGLKKYEVANMCGIAPSRFRKLMSNKSSACMDRKEFNSIRQFVTMREVSIAE